MASVSGTFLGFDVGDFGRVIAEIVQFGRDGALGRQFGVRIAVRRAQLPPDFRSGQARIQAVVAKLGVGLALPLHNDADILQQMGR